MSASTSSFPSFVLSETPTFVQSMSECTRKRKRQIVEDQDLSPSSSQVNDDKHKTRRINPYKLAERLPESLVKEMEVFIKPGAIMPNFEIRKELQTRYQVDRRHLYDYFHSRGLRVAKEDRHSNLTRSRIAKAKAFAQAQSGDVKENIKPMKPTKIIKLPPARRTSMKSSAKYSKKSVLIDRDPSYESNSTAYIHAQDVEAISNDEGSVSFDGTGFSDRETDLDNLSSEIESETDITPFADSSPETQSLCYAGLNLSSGRSTPSLVDDSSSCKSPSPSLVYLEEEPSSTMIHFKQETFDEIAAEFLNLPEEPEGSSYFVMDSLENYSCAPSIIGDLASSLDRKNLYEDIDMNIVSNGFSFALTYPRVESSFEALFSRPEILPIIPSLSLDLHVDSRARASQDAVNKVPSHSVATPHIPLPSSSTSTGFCIPPAALSKSPNVLSPSDLLSTQRAVHSFPVSTRVLEDAFSKSFDPASCMKSSWMEDCTSARLSNALPES